MASNYAQSEWPSKSDSQNKEGESLKIVSYNILSQILLEKHMDFYVNSERKFLEWDYRRNLIFETLRDTKADVICLQEVEEEALLELDECSKCLSISYLYKKRTGEHKDGCAIFYREDRLKLKKHCFVEFFKPNVRQSRHNVGIVATFRLLDSDVEVVIATTHILFNLKRHDIKLLQCQILLTEIDRQAYIDENNFRATFLTGDFNLNETSPVYDFLTKGSIDLNYVCKRSLRPLDEYRPRDELRASDLLPAYLGITDKCVYVRELEKRFNMSGLSLRDKDLVQEKTGRTLENVFYSKQLSHSLGFRSVFENDIGEVASTKHEETWVCVDHIFYNKKAQLISYLKLPEIQQCEMLVKAIPNEFYPSDHFLLEATFYLC